MDLSKCTDGQRESIKHLEGPLFIAAGAGSGKTFTLQNRIAYALSDESGPALSSIDEVLAITFMEKAAAEIKSRVRTALREEGKPEEALKVDAAWISTIHGMCSRILHENALEAGLDPKFEVLSEFDAKAFREEALERVLRRVRGADSNEDAHANGYAELFAEFGVESRGMKDIAVSNMLENLLAKSASFATGLDAVEFCSVIPSTGDVARRLQAAYRGVLEYAQIVQDPRKPKASIEKATLECADTVEALDAFLLTGEGSVPELADVIGGLNVLRSDVFGRNDAVGKELLLGLSETLDWAVRNVNAMLAAPHAEALRRLAKEVDAEYQRMLDDACALDNNGLLHRTLALLDEDSSVARKYQGRFKLVMVDEFQDTNRLQVALIEKVAGVENLCTVGDAQQSIYRFNGADVSVFEEQRAKVVEAQASGKPARIARLDANFRSHADVLTFVRHVCGKDWVFGGDFLDLSAGRKECGTYKDQGPRIELQVLSYEGSKEASGVVAAEASAIAERFAELRAAGHRAGEMVVLMGKMSNIDVYADALRERGFECVVGGGRSFFELPEVQVVRNVLTVLANPADSEALFAVLTSPMLHLSADDFLCLGTREADGRLVRRDIHEALLEGERAGFSEAARFALDLFDRAIARVKRDEPSRIVLDTLADSGWLARLEQEGACGTAVAANIFKTLRMVEDLESKPGYGIARVARDFREMAQTVGESPASLSVAEQDAVRIMTIHKSKGLEFPIVAVVAYEPWKSASETFSMMAQGDRVFVSLSAKESKVAANGGKKISHGFDGEACQEPAQACDAAEFAFAVRNYDWRQELAEAQRKLYVACTRASEYLLVGGLLKMSRKQGEVTYSYADTPILDDIRCGIFGISGEFPEESCEVESVDEGGKVLIRITREHYSKECPFGSESGDSQDCSGKEGKRTPSELGELQGPTMLCVSVLEERAPLACVPAPNRSGVFSYSSIAPHEDHLPVEERDDLSSAGGMAGHQEFADAEGGVSFEAGEFVPFATDVGSAFHRVGQLAVIRAGKSGKLLPPPNPLVDSIAKSYRIEGASRERLNQALERWFASDVARTVEGYARLRAEVPFMVGVDFGSGNAAEVRYLEGEIDLLAESDDMRSALVIDYKTGGSQDESPERLHAKHLLQATCYAYALLTTQGYEQVDFAFVRVEREDEEHPEQPQVVRYSFAARDIDGLRESIVAAYLKANAE